MAIDSHFIPAFSIEDVLLDKDTGMPLTGGQVLFEKANQPGVKKFVWQITNTSGVYSYTQLPNPMTLSSIGTFEDSLGNPVIPYFFPYDAAGSPEYYRIVVTSSGGVEQFVRDPQPYIADTGGTGVSGAYENEISNPQFSEVLFDTTSATHVYNFTAAIQKVVTIAPDWDIVVSCPAGGSVTVSQVRPAGTLNRITNPGTLLSINSAGLSSFRLRQRIYGSPNLWGSGYLSGSFVAKTGASAPTTLSLLYSQSNGLVVNQPIITATLPASGAYAAYPGSFLIPASDSTQAFPDAYIDIEFDMPLSVNVEITSVMLAMTGTTKVTDLIYDQESQNRQVDHLFHYYKPELEFKPIPSMLTGWDFPLNPAQNLEWMVTPTITTAPKYIWDQTICQSVVGNIVVARSGFTSGFEATTANNNEAFYMLQYLTGAEAREILGNELSVNINAFRSQTGGAVDCKVYLYSGRSISVFPALATDFSIGGATPLAADGTFTKNNLPNQGLNWTLIPRGAYGQAEGTLSVVDTGDYTQLNDVVDLKFSGWKLEESLEISNTTKFAIVVTFSCPVSGTVITVDSISMVKGSIPTRPAAQTLTEVRAACQYYYESSYAPGVAIKTPSAGGALFSIQETLKGGTIALLLRSFGFQFKEPCVTDNPSIILYSPKTGAENRVQGTYFQPTLAITGDVDIDSTSGVNYLQVELSATGVSFRALVDTQFDPKVGGSTNSSGSIIYHYVRNGRLGQFA